MASQSVGITFRLTEFAVRNFNRIDTAITKMQKAAARGTSATKSFNVAMTATGTVAAINLGAAAVKAAELEDALARLETVTASSSQTIGTSLKQAESAARQFSTEYSASASEIISAQFEIATAGVAVEEQVVATQGAFKLAQATVGDFTQTAQLLGQFLNTFGTSVQFGYLDPMTKVERITDVLATTVQRFQATLPVLAEGFKFIVGPARQLNLKLEEVSVALGILNTAGFRGTLAGTALSNMFNKLERAVERLDLDPTKFQDLEGNLTGLADFMQEVNKAMANMTPLEGQIKLIEVFDIRAGRVIKTLADSADALERHSTELEIARGATERMAKIVETTSSKSFKQFINSITNIGTSIGKVVNGALQPLFRSLTFVANAVGGFIERNNVLITSLATLATVTLLANAAVFLTTSIVKALTIAYRALTGAKAADTAATAANTAALGANTAAAAANAAGALRLISMLGRAAVALGVIARVVGIIIAAATVVSVLVAIGVAIAGVVVGFDLFSTAVEKSQAKIRAIREQFVDTASAARSLAAEIGRLGKAEALGVRAPIARGDSLGRTRVAVLAAEKFAQDPAIDLAEALRQAFAEIGQKGILKDAVTLMLGDAATLSNVEINTKALEGIIRDIELFDPNAVDLSPFEKSEMALKTLAKATDVAKRAIVGDASEIVDAFTKIENKFRTAEGFRLGGFTEQFQEEFSLAIENVVKQIDTLGQIPGLQKFVEDMRSLGVRADMPDDELEKFVNMVNTLGTVQRRVFMEGEKLIRGLGARYIELAPGISVITSRYDQYAQSVLRARTATTRLTSQTERLQKGLDTTDESLPKIAKRFNELQQAFEQAEEFAALEPLIQAKIDELKRAGLFVPKALQDALEESQAASRKALEIQVTIDREKLNVELAKSFKALTGIEIGEQVAKNIKAAGSAIEGALTSVITQAVKRQEGVINFNDSLKRLAGERAAGIVSDLVGAAFVGSEDRLKQFEVGVIKTMANAKSIIDEAFRSGDQELALELIRQSVERVANETLGISLNMKKSTEEASKLQEKLNSLTVDQLLADSPGEARFLDMIQRALEGPQTLPGLEKQAQRLVEITRMAQSTGFSDSAKRAGEELEDVLNRIDKMKLEVDVGIDDTPERARKLLEGMKEASKSMGDSLLTPAQTLREAALLLATSGPTLSSIGFALTKTIEKFSEFKNVPIEVIQRVNEARPVVDEKLEVNLDPVKRLVSELANRAVSLSSQPAPFRISHRRDEIEQHFQGIADRILQEKGNDILGVFDEIVSRFRGGSPIAPFLNDVKRLKPEFEKAFAFAQTIGNQEFGLLFKGLLSELLTLQDQVGATISGSMSQTVASFNKPVDDLKKRLLDASDGAFNLSVDDLTSKINAAKEAINTAAGQGLLTDVERKIKQLDAIREKAIAGLRERDSRALESAERKIRKLQERVVKEADALVQKGVISARSAILTVGQNVAAQINAGESPNIERIIETVRQLRQEMSSGALASSAQNLFEGLASQVTTIVGTLNEATQANRAVAEVQVAAGNATAEKLTTAAQNLWRTMTDGSDRMVQASEKVAQTVAQPFEAFERGTQTLERITTTRGERNLNMNVEIGGQSNFDIEINSNGGGSDGDQLTEQEIQDSLEEVRKGLLRYVDDRMREVEDRLRSR